MRLTSRSALSSNPPAPVMLAVWAGGVCGAAGCCANVETNRIIAGTIDSASPIWLRHRDKTFMTPPSIDVGSGFSRTWDVGPIRGGRLQPDLFILKLRLKPEPTFTA